MDNNRTIEQSNLVAVKLKLGQMGQGINELSYIGPFIWISSRVKQIAKFSDFEMRPASPAKLTKTVTYLMYMISPTFGLSCRPPICEVSERETTLIVYHPRVWQSRNHLNDHTVHSSRGDIGSMECELLKYVVWTASHSLTLTYTII